MRTTLVAKEFSEENLAKVLEIEKDSFPPEWQYEDAESHYRQMLSNKENINVFLWEDKEQIGYLLARPHNDVFEELKDIDTFLRTSDERYYVETIEVLPEFRNHKGALMLIHAMIKEAADRKGFNKFSMHVRVMNGLSSLVRRFFGHCMTEDREIESWPYGGGERYAYMETTYYDK